tara:strand:+ start:194 stop:379 length:186 start_codon:yes stop_codon:yes gene_type:complete
MQTLFSIIAILCLIFAVGAIDGPTLETSGNNFVLCFVLATVGIMSMFLAIKSQQYNDKEDK